MTISQDDSAPNLVSARYRELYDRTKPHEMTLLEYLELCKTDKMAYATPHERMLAAIGEPRIVNTQDDDRLKRVFSGRNVAHFEPFHDFYGMEDVIDSVVKYFKKGAQGLEERKQVLYLLGPVGSSKSTLAERIKRLMQKQPIYRLKGSPINESPLGLFDKDEWGPFLEDKYGIPSRYLINGIMSPWAAKRLREFDGDIMKFTVERVYPSISSKLAIARTEPGDENNQDISALVGKIDIRMLERFEQDDPDAYSYSGGLNKSNRGLLEFVEMFKAPIKVLNPLLSATQDGQYQGTEGGALPYSGIILAHSNESEWLGFKGNRNNEAFLDRVCVVKVPYCLRYTDEVKIYEKLLRESKLATAPCAPGTLEMLAQFAVLSRLEPVDNASIYSKMRVYNGENMKDIDPKAKSYQEFKNLATPDEGMSGMSTRSAFKTLSETFNHNANTGGEIEANPVHLLFALENWVESERFSKEKEDKLRSHIKEYLAPTYAEYIGKEIQTAYLESYAEYGQNIFDRYVTYADFWLQDQDYREPNTGEMFDKATLNEELSKIEKPAGISNPKDFRNEVVNFCLRARTKNEGKNPAWTSYEKLRLVIEKKMFGNTEEMLPVISFTGAKASADEQKKHNDFVDRMVDKGYTEGQVRLLCEWYLRVRKAGAPKGP